MSDEPRRVDALQAIADPIRLDMLRHLALSAVPLSTAELGRLMPEARRGMQAHLKRLQEAHYVRQVAGDGKDALWERAAGPSVEWSDEDEQDQDAKAEAADALDKAVRALRRRDEDHWVTDRRTVWAGTPWPAASISHDYLLHLTPEELHELEDQLREVIDRFARAYGGGRDNAPASAEVVFLTLAAFPRPKQ